MLIVSILYMFFMLSANTALAQTDNTAPKSSGDSTGFNFSMVAILLTLIVIFSLLVLSTICITNRVFGNTPFTSRANFMHTARNADLREIQVTKTPHGLDRNVLDTFPIMKYIEIMELILTKDPLECRVCLSEFADHDWLRLIPGCCHVFHPTCIDAWLTHNVHCPVCRSDLTNAAMIAVNQNQDNMSQPDLMEVSVNRFMLTLPVHLREEIQVSAGHHLSARIGSSPYDVTVISKSGGLWSFTRTQSNR